MAKTYQIMIYRPTVFTLEADSFEDAQEKIINSLFLNNQAKPSSPIIFQEITDAQITENEETTSAKEQSVE